MITEQQLLTAKKKAEQLRNKKIEAQATMLEIGRTIQSHEDELTKLGRDPATVADWLETEAKEIDAEYNAIIAKFPEE